MKVKILRNLGNDLVRQLAADEVDLPEAHENCEIDLPDEHAAKLIEHGLAEPLAAKGAKAKGAKGDGTAGAAGNDRGDNPPMGQEGTWASSTAREQLEQDAVKRAQVAGKDQGPATHPRTSSADAPDPKAPEQPKPGDQKGKK